VNDADGAVGKLYPVSHEDMRVDTADIGKAQETFFGDVGNHHADLVHVRGDHHLQASTVAHFAGDQVTHSVYVHLVGIRFYLRPDQVTHFVFKS
jgi:hypothetical protein